LATKGVFAEASSRSCLPGLSSAPVDGFHQSYDLQASMDIAEAREAARHEEIRRVHAWLRHPATIEAAAATFYEERTGRTWRTAEEIDRIAYIANARAVLRVLLNGLKS
jgi:hypothetical protein